MRRVSDKELLSRFEPELNTGCWLWTGGVGPRGYGKICRDGKHIRAHRFFYECLVGPIPDGLLVCHRCDTPGCVNPAHLFVGTTLDNVHDKLSKGRAGVLCGEAQPAAKLTAIQAAEIRASVARGVDLARAYGVSPSAICLIRKGRNWRATPARA